MMMFIRISQCRLAIAHQAPLYYYIATGGPSQD